MVKLKFSKHIIVYITLKLVSKIINNLFHSIWVKFIKFDTRLKNNVFISLIRIHTKTQYHNCRVIMIFDMFLSHTVSFEGFCNLKSVRKNEIELYELEETKLDIWNSLGVFIIILIIFENRKET